MPKTTHDMVMESLTVQYASPENEKARTIANLKEAIADKQRELEALRTRLKELEG
jgi:hypothetical protein